ncbi:MAG TPA: hypothetical protein VLC95_12905 [Anaerolineae bacterium]|nr:hypothetical protein [Anaerolineae bacterium]
MPLQTLTASLNEAGAWLTLAGFGAYHGINPAMGWLFALALGLQQKSDRAIWAALVPITLGHAASVALAAAVILALRTVVSLQTLQLVTAVLLIGFGAYKLFNWYRHPKWVGMRVGWLELAGWSFLMATAHGAGLMVAPALLGVMDMSHSDMLFHSTGANVGLAVGGHTASMLVTMIVVAWVVYRRLGLMVLRRGWLNFDLIWSAALLAVGGISLAVAV